MIRRDYLKELGIATAVLAGGAGGASATNDRSADGDDTYQIRTADDLVALSADELQELSNEEIRNPFNPQIGGGRWYDADSFEGARVHGGTVRKTDADYRVSTLSALKEALSRAKAGDVVWIDSDAEIDVTHESMDVPGGVTVASNRGQGEQDGAKLYQTEGSFAPTFVPQGDGTRFTGIRFRAPDTEYWELEDRGISDIYEYGQNYAIRIFGHADTEIDNCSFRGFCYAGIRIGDYPDTAEGTYVHHCEFVDTPSPSLGYGVTVWSANPLIEYCYFDNNRHAIAGHGGVVNTSYTFRNNLCGPRTRLHVIDMHGGFSFNGQENVMKAGETMIVKNNVVLATKAHVGGYPQDAVTIRSIPQDKAVIANNWFFQPPPPFSDTTTDSKDEGQTLEQAGRDGDAIVQWRTDVYKNIEAWNNICEGAHPIDDIGVDSRWEPRTSR
ncbi:right-handed parallel beta-helix repeat-containing protein [Haladaptatus sp. DFWS20]|uniref:right-handed parallel beta-helix repeat-containing protein n=1 Tax=Haladaptatus sp. DFWS20 TaxID=3403467 RepID=UPI003EBEA550